MQYFVYALSKKWQTIVAALSCPDEKTGKQAFVMACQQLARNLEDSICGVVSLNERTTINVHGSEGQGTVKLKFKVQDFEIAAKQTKERFSEGNASGSYDDFMRTVGVAMAELTGDIEPVRVSFSVVEEKVEDIVKNEFSKLEHDVETREHEVVDAIHSIFDRANRRTIPQSDYVANRKQAAIGEGHLQSAIATYNASVVLADEPANVNINGIAPVVLPIPVYLVELPAPVVSEDLPDFDKDGFFEPQELFANRTGWSERTLENHREKKNNPIWFENGTIGKSRAGHFFRTINNKHNSPYEYFVYHDPEKNRRLHKQ